MTTGRHLAERFAETLTAHDLDAFSTLLHPDYVNHNAFDDFRAEVNDIIDSENTVVGRYTYRGRHTGTFLGVTASGAEIEMHSIDIWRVRDGLLAEHWDELNTLEFFQQIGAAPALA